MPPARPGPCTATSGATAHAAVACSGLNVDFGRREILRDIRLLIPAGTIAALVGPCGAGKTTLIKALAGLIPAAAGTIRVCDQAVTTGSPGTRRQIGFSPAEERSFYWRLSGRENLRFFAALQGMSGADSERRIEVLLRTVGLEEQTGLRFQEYSSGMRQALGIARALLHDPPVLLLDEPTRSLSPDMVKRVHRILLRKAREEGAAILISSHNLREVERIADDIHLMDRGRIRASGTLEELLATAGLGPDADLEALFDHHTGG